ncbi:hypothetical protein PFLUV_G00076690 [Perca fluviatilis]|uniref:Uncharacterized protein n=1 Tax=Perca fluviatilis TaxID=8168 RepID=A0A6A5FHV6_PERFL|nr:hypothetical protein PFLUV_G00076690 [Perca fluviatilis]
MSTFSQPTALNTPPTSTPSRNQWRRHYGNQRSAPSASVGFGSLGKNSKIQQKPEPRQKAQYSAKAESWIRCIPMRQCLKLCNRNLGFGLFSISFPFKTPM